MYSIEEQDPYNTSKNEIEGEVERIKAFLERFRQLYVSGSNDGGGGINEELKWVQQEIKKSLKKIEFELPEICKSIEIVENNSDKFPEIYSKINSRKLFVSEVETTIKKIKQDLSQKEREMKKIQQSEMKKNLYGGVKGYGSKNNHYQKLKEFDEKENEDYLQDEFQKQQMAQKKTKEGVKKIIQKVGLVKEKALGMGDEVDRSKEMLDDLEAGVDKADNIITRTTKKVKDLVKKSGDTGKICCIILLAIILVVLIIVLFVT